MAGGRRKDEVKRVEEAERIDPDVFAAMISQLGATRHSKAVDMAQEIMFDAWDCQDSRRRVAMARRALKVSPLCADAWILLAEETARTQAQRLDLYAKAVAAGEKALGKAAFRDDVGMFWGLIETRPYMRARQGLALELWAAGLGAEAAAGAQDMLRLNPNDNQGIRYLLLDWLLQLGRDADGAQLFKRYKGDGGAEWMWSAALMAFRKGGDCAIARTALTRAIGANRHVGPYLTGRKKLPRVLPDYVSWGGVDEAVSYAANAKPTWAGTPGAVEWLAGRLPPAAALLSGTVAARARRGAAQ